MRKNIAIFGVSRSGKSTLAKMIAKKWKRYHILCGDEIRDAFMLSLPDTGISNFGGEGMNGDFQRFLQKMFHLHVSKNRDDGIHYIIETCDMYPKQASELFDRNDTIILFLGYPKLSSKEHFEIVREYENEKDDWTSSVGDDDLMEHSEYCTRRSKGNQKQCEELGIWYADTSHDRDQILEEVLHEISKKMRGRKPKNLPS